MSTKSTPPKTWVLLQPTGAVHGDELVWVAMRRFIKALVRQYGIRLLDIRENLPEAPTAQPNLSDAKSIQQGS